MLLRPISSKRRRGQKGSSLLEGALALLAFLTMTFGLIEASMAIYAFNTVAYGAGAAARAAALHGTTAPTIWATADVQNYVNNQSPGLIRSRLRTTPTWTPNNTVGSVVKVNIQYDVVPLVHMVFGRTFTISSTAQMTITQ
jgi:Flp pilus assembly protein TadG